MHPKDKQDEENVTECVYKVPCANCEKIYVGETGTKLGVRLQEQDQKSNQRVNELSLEVNAQPASRNTTSPHLPTMPLKETTRSTGRKL